MTCVATSYDLGTAAKIGGAGTQKDMSHECLSVTPVKIMTLFLVRKTTDSGDWRISYLQSLQVCQPIINHLGKMLKRMEMISAIANYRMSRK